MGARYTYCLSSNFQWDSHIPHHPGLKCEPPSLVPALQIHELNGRSDAIGEVIAEAAEAAEQLVWVPEGILDGAATLVNASALCDYVFCRMHVVLWNLPNDRDPVLMHNCTRSN
jgi:hypothetical protein